MATQLPIFGQNAKASECEWKCEEPQTSSGPQIVLMRKMFAPKPRPAVPQPTPSEPPTATEVTPADMVDYLSEHSDSDEDGSGSDEVDEHEPPNTSSSHRVYCRSNKGGGQGSQSNIIRPIMPPTTWTPVFWLLGLRARTHRHDREKFAKGQDEPKGHSFPVSREQRESPYEKPPPKTPTPSPSTLRPSTSCPKPRSAYPGTRTNVDAQPSSRAAPTTGPEKALTGAEYLTNISTRCVVEEILKKFPHSVPERRLLWDSISKLYHPDKNVDMPQKWGAKCAVMTKILNNKFS
ncbi:hypothetical protein B0H14DRAFT_2581135 [Mycena olivaceomarginata]|nr:hypothetical protein B0H14DRAFT_2581135 [Mycena olivaceomarginata]